MRRSRCGELGYHGVDDPAGPRSRVRWGPDPRGPTCSWSIVRLTDLDPALLLMPPTTARIPTFAARLAELPTEDSLARITTATSLEDLLDP